MKAAGETREDRGEPSAPAPGKATLAGLFAASARRSKAVLSKLDPDLIAILDAGDVDKIIYALKRRPSGKGILDAAFEYVRAKHGATFVEQLSREMFPRKQADWFGLSEFLDEQHSDGDPTNDPRPLERRRESAPSDAVEPDDFAVHGVSFYLRTDPFILGRPDTVHPPGKFGPASAGPYRLTAHSFEDRIVFWKAFHQERDQHEWVIGPDSIDEFERSANLYAGVAARSLPGAEAVPSSRADGASRPVTEPSFVEKETRGEAPWQVLAQAADDTNGGTAIISAGNAAIRLANYEAPARQLAQRLLADLESGKLDHLEARNQAVVGRNHLLTEARRDMSPAAAKASQAIKSDRGVSVSDMQRRKTAELLRNHSGRDKKNRPLPPEKAQQWKAILDADSDLWAQHAKAVQADPDAFADAMRVLGESPEVSKAIIRSAGRPNRLVSGMARLQLAGGVAGAVIGAIDAYQEIANASDAERLHAIARAGAGFVGGIVGAEGAVWIASAIMGGLAGASGVGAPVVIVVTLLAGAAGGMAGAHVGVSLADMFASASAAAVGPGHSMAAGGGYAGAHARGNPRGRNLGESTVDAIFKLDQQLRRFDRAIPSARDRQEMEALQRRRLEMLEERGKLEDLLMAVRLGLFEANESRLPEEEVPEPPPAPPDMPHAEPCPDDDCDNEVW
ncbi:MAG: hypothetical protein K8M05_09285 [Deltaproteobacteria bacterium]|nr:hypothetical protein [Kofleriaceae bacterium]